MRPAGLAALGAALLALWLPPTVGGILTNASPAESYMSGRGDRFQLPSNGKFTDAKEITRYNTVHPLNKPPGQEERVTSIWGETCKPRREQTVKFRRTIDIPGPPSKATFQITPDFGSFANPLERYVLRIAGQKVAAGRVSQFGRGETVLGPTQLKLFRDGPNLVEVTVKRDELPEGVRRCNTAKKNRVGVLFTLMGDFSADLGLVEPAPAANMYKRARTPQRFLIVNLSVFNRGPSALVPGAGAFIAQVSGASDVLLAGDTGGGGGSVPPGATELGPPFGKCQQTGTSVVTVDCELTRMASGASGVLSLGVRKEFSNTNFGESSTSVSWQTGSTVADPKTENNRRTVNIVWCGDKATSPGCASAD